MKKYKKILSFGCSFTEGGGLNSPIYHNYLNGIINKNDTTPSQEHNEYATANAYPAQLANMLGCEFNNCATSRSSNGLILKTLYEQTCNIEDGSDILITVQTTLLSRIMLYLDKSKEFLTMNNFENLSKEAREYYKLYLKNFFNEDIEFKKLMQSKDVYTAYLQKKNFDVVWLMYDTDNTDIQSTTTLMFDNTDLSQFIAKERLRISDLKDFPVNDTHFSVEGHCVIADRIFKHLEKNYD